MATFETDYEEFERRLREYPGPEAWLHYMDSLAFLLRRLEERVAALEAERRP